MVAAVRYFSVLGNTKAIAEEIATGAGVEAVSIADEPELSEHVDVLFLGGAPYANVMAPELRAYAEGLSADKVGRVVLFSTSNWSRRTVLALRKILKGKGIPVESDHFWAHMLRIRGSKPAARAFGVQPHAADTTGAVDRQAVAYEAVSSAVIVAALAVTAFAVVHRLRRGNRRKM